MTTIFFTQENTEGFTDQELSILNQAAVEQTANETDELVIDSITDKILHDYKKYI